MSDAPKVWIVLWGGADHGRGRWSGPHERREEALDSALALSRQGGEPVIEERPRSDYPTLPPLPEPEPWRVERRLEAHNLDGSGEQECEVYYVEPREEDYWEAVTACPCPVPGCSQRVAWWEIGGTPGYRICMATLPTGDGPSFRFNMDSQRHHFIAGGDAAAPCLIRHKRAEAGP